MNLIKKLHSLNLDISWKTGRGIVSCVVFQEIQADGVGLGMESLLHERRQDLIRSLGCQFTRPLDSGIAQL